MSSESLEMLWRDCLQQWQESGLTQGSEPIDGGQGRTAFGA